MTAGAGRAAPAEVRVEAPSPEDYATLMSSAGWDAPSADDCRRALDATVLAARAVCGGETVGMARLVGDGVEYWVLVDVVVTPGRQGEGIGTELVTVLEREVARHAPGATLLLFCAQGLVPFYERLGYARSPGQLMKKSVAGP